jgi:hypothetical protein
MVVEDVFVALPVLSTRRLRLRGTSQDDVDGLFDLFSAYPTPNSEPILAAEACPSRRSVVEFTKERTSGPGCARGPNLGSHQPRLTIRRGRRRQLDTRSTHPISYASCWYRRVWSLSADNR